jgi:hypothetical protein
MVINMTGADFDLDIILFRSLTANQIPTPASK